MAKRIKSIREWLTQFRSEGFKPHAPVEVQIWTRQIDKATCRCLLCGHCGHKGLLYLPFHHINRYWVLAKCPKCGSAEEI
jgi:hypothetical protein